MILDLIVHEIMYNFPKDRPSEDGVQLKYNLYCSEAFYRSLVDGFMNAGFTMPVVVKNEKTLFLDEEERPEPNFTMFQLPNIGYLVVKRELEQGYKIERYEEKENV